MDTVWKALILGIAGPVLVSGTARGWMADNGNGTFTNPLFYDEFSDPDLIRVGEDYYLTGTTMHSMPGLPILHSRDLVNWELLGYALDRLDMGPQFRLEGGEVYGQGIWAPCFRYHNGTFHIFTNVNGQTTQLFRAANPAGPWTRTAMKCSLHDLSVLFDDDGKVYVVWGYREIRMAELNEDLTDLVPGSERIIIEKDAGMGEGVHFYKINGMYYITSAWFAGRMRMPCARAKRPEGPYEVNPAISTDEDFGLAEGYRLRGRAEPPFDVIGPNTNDGGRMSLHQGGVVDTPEGQWWGFSMMDYNSVGRLTCLSPVTWKDGWPYFGLEGNLKRTPRTWVKPETKYPSEPKKPFERNDDFSGPNLRPVWQWNHVPDDSKWSLSERPGCLRLYSSASKDLWTAKNTLTQRSIGPVSIPTAGLETGGMELGDTAGLALMNCPYAWIGVSRTRYGTFIEQFNQLTGGLSRVPFRGRRVWLRARCDFLTEKAQFSYSTDGRTFEPLGGEFTMIFQLKTFQGVRYSLFHYNTEGAGGGYADFDEFTVEEPHPRGLMRPIPFGRQVKLTTRAGDAVLAVRNGVLVGAAAGGLAVGEAAWFEVVDCGPGRVALKSGEGYVSAAEDGGSMTAGAKEIGPAQTFQWVENVYGDLMLMSLATHRHVRIDPASGAVRADWPGPKPDRKDGSCFVWEEGTAR